MNRAVYGARKLSFATILLAFGLAGYRADATTLNLPTVLPNLLAPGVTTRSGPFEYSNFMFRPIGGYDPSGLSVNGTGTSSLMGLTFISGTSLDLFRLGQKGYFIDFDFKTLDPTQAVSGFTIFLASGYDTGNVFAVMTGQVSGTPFFNKFASFGLHGSVDQVEDVFPHPITSGSVSLSLTLQGRNGGQVGVGLTQFQFGLTKNVGQPPGTAPEPASIGFAGAGLALLLCLQKARKRSAAH